MYCHFPLPDRQLSGKLIKSFSENKTLVFRQLVQTHTHAHARTLKHGLQNWLLPDNLSIFCLFLEEVVRKPTFGGTFRPSLLFFVHPSRKSFIFTTTGLYPPTPSWSYGSHETQTHTLYVTNMQTTQRNPNSFINSFISLIQVTLFYSDALCPAHTACAHTHTHTYTRSLC